MSWFGGTQDKIKTLSTKTAGQQGLMEMLQNFLGGGGGDMPGMGYLQGILGDDPNLMSQYEKPMMRQFNEQVVPGMAERFSGSGMGSRNSSAFQNQMGQAGQRLSEGLGAQRAQLKQGAMNQILQMLGISQDPSQENMFVAGQEGMGSSLFQGLGQGLAQAGGASMFGGMPGLNFGGGSGSGGRGMQNGYSRKTYDPSGLFARG